MSVYSSDASSMQNVAGTYVFFRSALHFFSAQRNTTTHTCTMTVTVRALNFRKNIRPVRIPVQRRGGMARQGGGRRDRKSVV